MQTELLEVLSIADARQQMTTIDPKLLKPVLIGTDGFYQIGPVEAGSDRFILSTTVAFASNLVQVAVKCLKWTLTFC